MSALAARLAPAGWLFWPAVAAALALVAAGTGLLPLVPFLLVALTAVVLTVPMRTLTLAFVGLALLADNPADRPMAGLWKSPFWPIGNLLYENLHKHTGVQALRFSLIELLIAALLALVALRRLRADPIDDIGAPRAWANPLLPAWACVFGAVVALEVWGLARGGDFRNSLWQLRVLFWLPLLGLLSGSAFATEGARANLLRVLMAVSWVRCLTGAWFWYTIGRHRPLDANYATTHHDSVLTVVAVLIALAALVDRPTREHIVLNLVTQPVYLLGLFTNQRRMAILGLGLGLVALVMTGPVALRRVLIRLGLLVLPVLVGYTLLGLVSSSRVFAPVHVVQGMAASQDASSQTRDIENYNLIQTLRPHLVLGTGFGHEYSEQVRALRVDQFFAQYRFIAHNSVLWILSISGIVGFSLLWSVFPLIVRLALYAHARATSTVDRVTAVAALAATLAFVVQAWGDMGLIGWMAALVLASLAGAAGTLATSLPSEGVTA